MIIFCIISFVIGDEITPSLRISSLGSEFTYLVEDYITDIQYNPALLGNLNDFFIYLKPEWSTYWNYSSASMAVFYPKTLKNITSGFWTQNSYINYTNITIDNYSNATELDTTFYSNKSPGAKFFLIFPFIKDGGFMGVKLSYNALQNKQANKRYYSFNDTSYFGIDTTIVEEKEKQSMNTSNNEPILALRVSQHLPLTNSNSALNFFVSFSSETPTLTNSDTSISNNSTQYVNHNGLIRELHIHKRVNDMLISQTEKIKNLSTTLGFNWSKYLYDSYLRFYLEVGGKRGSGEITTDIANIDFYETYYEYASPDTFYSITDTVRDIRTVYTLSARKELKTNSGRIGLGYKKSITDNFNLFIGIKGSLSREDISVKDSTESINSLHSVALPIGVESFITKGVCIIAGINIKYSRTVYEYKYHNNLDSEKEIYEDFGLTRSFGFGFNVKRKLLIHIFSSSGYLTQLDNWKLEAQYIFK